MPFSSLPRPVAEAIAERGYETPTPVQAQVIAAEAHDRDLLVSAQTGSGKTVAYGLAIANTLLQGAETLPRPGEPLALIIAPTRELALQVERELQWLYAKLGARVTSCVGGMNVRVEQRALSHGCHIVVGTPGRLKDHLERGTLQPGSLRAVILDEADEMLDLGFREDLEEILDLTPPERRSSTGDSAPLRDRRRLPHRPFSATVGRGADVKRSEWRSRPDAIVDLTPPSMRQPPRIEGLAWPNGSSSHASTVTTTHGGPRRCTS